MRQSFSGGENKKAERELPFRLFDRCYCWELEEDSLTSSLFIVLAAFFTLAFNSPIRKLILKPNKM